MYKKIAGTSSKDIGRIMVKRCFALADTHGKHLDLGKISGDWFFMSGKIRFFLILAGVLISWFLGDFTANGTRKEVVAFNDWLGTLDFEEKFIVAGKSDLALDPALNRSSDKTKELITNAHYLEDSGVNIMGMKIFGTPWSQDPAQYGAFHLENEADAKRKFDDIPEDVDILMSYTPPFGTLAIPEIHIQPVFTLFRRSW